MLGRTALHQAAVLPTADGAKLVQQCRPLGRQAAEMSVLGDLAVLLVKYNYWVIASRSEIDAGVHVCVQSVNDAFAA